MMRAVWLALCNFMWRVDSVSEFLNGPDSPISMGLEPTNMVLDEHDKPWVEDAGSVRVSILRPHRQRAVESRSSTKRGWRDAAHAWSPQGMAAQQVRWQRNARSDPRLESETVSFMEEARQPGLLPEDRLDEFAEELVDRVRALRERAVRQARNLVWIVGTMVRRGLQSKLPSLRRASERLAAIQEAWFAAMRDLQNVHADAHADWAREWWKRLRSACHSASRRYKRRRLMVQADDEETELRLDLEDEMLPLDDEQGMDVEEHLPEEMLSASEEDGPVPGDEGRSDEEQMATSQEPAPGLAMTTSEAGPEGTLSDPDLVEHVVEQGDREVAAPMNGGHL